MEETLPIELSPLVSEIRTSGCQNRHCEFVSSLPNGGKKRTRTESELKILTGGMSWGFVCRDESMLPFFHFLLDIRDVFLVHFVNITNFLVVTRPKKIQR